jgi:hypothetical protein
MKTKQKTSSTNKILISMALLISLGMALVNFTSVSKDGGDDLLTGFQNPGNAAKPRVWWHWMNGNISKDGIKKDLLWMNRSGIGGFQNFDAALMTPQIVEKRLTYMTPEWQDAFRFTTKLADSLKLEMAIAGSPGWSESGGPWVKPEDGMKKVVWTEIRVKGGAANLKLVQPSGITGPFQNIPKQPEFGVPVDQSKLPSFYKDIAVLAFKLPAADKSLSDLGAVITSSGGSFSLAQLTDGDLEKTSLLPRDEKKGFAWIQFAFAKPQTIKAITMVGGGEPGMFGQGAAAADSRTLETSADGVNFKAVCFIPPGGILQQTLAIPETTARYFRVTVKNPPEQMNAMAAMMGMNVAPVTPPGTEIAEIVLHPVARINRFEEKDAFSPATELYAKATVPTREAVAEKDIIDLTNKMNPDGTLNWTAPAGEWKVVRFGYSLLGIENHPASPEATGPEVDKLDPVAIKNYFDNYLDQYKSATGGLMGNKGGLQFMVTDSWEAGAQNWTGNLPQEFQKRRGYSLIPWMPVLTGQVVKSAEASEQFLFDFRKTLSDLVAEYHYDGLTKILAEHGMKRYSESHESGRALIADGMEVKRTAAIPMSAMWTPNIYLNQNDQTGYVADIRESASVSHIYGQNLVAAESLTAFGIGGSAWSYCPENLKPTADLELANGLNRFVIHCSPHQPVDDKIPGLGLGPFGQWFTRHETWAEQASAWTSYLSRSSYMLQQGKMVADVLYYYGEDNNITALFGKKLPAIPEGYNYDFVNADALKNVLSVKDGKLVTPSGMSYRVLVLDANSQQMSLPVLRKIGELVAAGAIVAGPKPLKSPSLSDNPIEFKKLVDTLWGTGTGVQTINKGKIYAGQSAAEVLKTLNILPDFNYTKPQANTNLLYVHRSTGVGEIYWVNNRNDRAENLDATFRVEGKAAEIWHPETGKTELASYSIKNGQTIVPLHLEPNDAVFVVFRKKAEGLSRTIPAKTETQLSTIDGSWNVSFQPNLGAPVNSTFEKLASWSENTDSGIKYFSGTGSYSKTVDAPESWFKSGEQLWLDLGEVKNLAEVVVNGKSLGILWKKPFRIDISGAIKSGKNTLEVKVTNLWVNRLIGDEQPGVEKKITYTTMPFYQANSPLLSSGLIGPVKILSVK